MAGSEQPEIKATKLTGSDKEVLLLREERNVKTYLMSTRFVPLVLAR